MVLTMLKQHKIVTQQQYDAVVNKSKNNKSVFVQPELNIADNKRPDSFKVDNTAGRWIFDSSRHNLEIFIKENDLDDSLIIPLYL